MSKPRNFKLFITDILDAIRNIKEYTKDMNFDKFSTDKKTIDAVIRNLEIIGEAVKNIPTDIKMKHSKISWNLITGMRDKLIHEYFGVSIQIVWETVINDLPIFESQIKSFEKSNEISFSAKNNEKD